MNLNINVEYESKISELTKKFKNLRLLEKHIKKNSNDANLQVIFIGKTGYGKSSTLNAITGKHIFETDDVSSCTKKLYSAKYKINDKKSNYFSLCDLPGVGESVEADKKYLKWYKKILIESNCVIYVLRADQRDFSIDEQIFNQLFKNDIEKNKLIIALNYVDKIDPINRDPIFNLSELQLKNLNKKKNEISKLFNISKRNIICYSAQENYNINKLVNKLVSKMTTPLIK